MSYYIHQIPGRLRIKTPFLKRAHVSREIGEMLLRIEGIRSVEVNPVTGSMVIRYSPDLTDSEQILSLIESAGYFDSMKAVTNDEYIHAKATKTGRVIWGAISGAFMETALEKSALSLIAILI